MDVLVSFLYALVQHHSNCNYFLLKLITYNTVSKYATFASQGIHSLMQTCI